MYDIKTLYYSSLVWFSQTSIADNCDILVPGHELEPIHYASLGVI